MKLGFGHMHYSPRVFWSMSLREWQACYLGYMEKMGADNSKPMTTSGLNSLMERYPDDRPVT